LERIWFFFLCKIVKYLWCNELIVESVRIANEICEQSALAVFCVKMDRVLKHNWIILGPYILD
jgi:hypothetical protein